MKISESILRALRGPVLVLDGSLRAVLANTAFYDLLQIGPGELEGKPVQDLIAGGNAQPQLRTVLDTVVRNDSNVEDLEIECAIPPRTQKVLSVNAHRLPVGEEGGELVLVELRDITREKETEQRITSLNDVLELHGIKLESINKDLESFADYISHDLRTPLRLTNKIAHLLLQDHDGQLPAGAIEKINMILDSTQEMAKLIEALLLFSHVNREPIRKRRVDMRRLAHEALEELRTEQQARNVEVVIDELPPCKADRVLLKQVLLNVLANAMKFTQPCGQPEIHVGFSQANRETVYFVRDNGVGFDMRHAESMFLPFHRLHKTQHFEGSGIGLALVKRIIERHAGRIWAESGVDQGATFYFTLGV